MKLLYISNIASKRMAYNFTGAAIEAAHFLGYEFIGVANRSNSTPTDIKEDEEKYGIKLLHINLARSPFSKQNIIAYKQLCNIIRENNIEYIHCNTPVGGMLGRLAGKKYGVKKVLYQAHGFHFYIGNMTLIGPRASGAGALDSYLEDEVAKMDVKPGITGYTQAYYRNNLGVREKRLYDAWYAHNVTMWLDIKILFKTVATVLKHENLYTNSEEQNVKEK